MRSLKVKKENTVFVAIDLQERLLPSMAEKEEVTEVCVRLARGIKALGVPAIVTQQYTKGLGATVEPFADALGEYTLIEKTDFSAMGVPEFEDALKATGRKSVVLCGVEAHVCVLETAIDLLEAGYNVFIVRDGVSSRKESDKECAMARAAAAGAAIVTYESVLFEMIGGAKAPGFKEISAIVK